MIDLILILGLLAILLLYADAAASPEVTVERDVVYGTVDGYELRLDIAYGKDAKSPAPAIIQIHGGGWRMGRKSPDAARRYAERGYVGISIAYRLSGVAPFPASVHDCKRAVRWARANAERYRIDPGRIGATGGSAGGHLAALLGTSAGDPYLEGDSGYLEHPSRVQAVVDHFGPTDFLRMNDAPGRIDHMAPDSPESLFIGGPIGEHPDRVRKANPIAYIDERTPPTLIVHGEQDGVVIVGQSELLYNALRGAGVRTEFIRVKNAGHGYHPVPGNATICPDREEISRLELAWFDEILKPNARS